MKQRGTEPSQGTVRRFSARAAAPKGGAGHQKWPWFRGCFLYLTMCATSVTAQISALPSGQSVMLDAVLIDTVGGENWLRFRFLAPQIARGSDDVSYNEASDDFVYLCENVARPYLIDQSLSADVIVISMMDRPVVFGTSDPNATQFFEAFRIKEDSCEMDIF